jgi:hypothetical protein
MEILNEVADQDFYCVLELSTYKDNPWDHVVENEEKRQAAIESARRLYAQLRKISDSQAFDQARFGETLCLYYILFVSKSDVQTKVAQLRESIRSYEFLAEADYPFLEGADESAITEIKHLKNRMQIELLFLEILRCIDPPDPIGRVSTARGDIDDFLDYVFDVP